MIHPCSRLFKLERMASRTPLTIDDYERLPADIVKNKELVDGELVDEPGNTPRHNLLKIRLLTILSTWLRGKSRGRVIGGQGYDFLGNVYGPDISFFGPAKQALLVWDKRVQR